MTFYRLVYILSIMGVGRISINYNTSNYWYDPYSKKLSISQEVADLIPSSLARQYRLFPIKLENKQLFIAIEDPYNFVAIDHIKRITGFKIISCETPKDIINHHLDQLYGNEPIEKALEDFNNELHISEPQSNG